jgi:hypothetical protein
MDYKISNKEYANEQINNLLEKFQGPRKPSQGIFKDQARKVVDNIKIKKITEIDPSEHQFSKKGIIEG